MEVSLIVVKKGDILFWEGGVDFGRVADVQSGGILFWVGGWILSVA